MVCQWSAGQVTRCWPQVALVMETRPSFGPSAALTTRQEWIAHSGTRVHGRLALIE